MNMATTGSCEKLLLLLKKKRKQLTYNFRHIQLNEHLY